MTTTSDVRFGRCYGGPFVPIGGPIISLTPLVALVAPAEWELDRDPAAPVGASFHVQRGRNPDPVCSVAWRVEGSGTNPVLPEHFAGGSGTSVWADATGTAWADASGTPWSGGASGGYPSGVLVFAAGVTDAPASFLLSPGPDPALRRTGRLLLEAPSGCEISPAAAEAFFSLKPAVVEPGDAIVGLEVGFSEIVLDPPTGGGNYALGPDYRTNWTLQQASTAHSSIEQLTASPGVILDADVSDDSDIFLWAKTAMPARWKLTCDYTWLDGLAGEGGGTFTRFGYTRGIGSKANPNLWSSADWDGLTDPHLDANTRGVRASVNTKNENQPILTDQCRMRQWNPDVPGTPDIDPVGANAFTFVSGTEYRLEITRDGDEMTFRKSATGTTTESVAFIAPEISNIGEAWICWAAVNGRRCRIRNLTVEAL